VRKPAALIHTTLLQTHCPPITFTSWQCNFGLQSTTVGCSFILDMLRPQAHPEAQVRCAMFPTPLSARYTTFRRTSASPDITAPTNKSPTPSDPPMKDHPRPRSSWIRSRPIAKTSLSTRPNDAPVQNSVAVLDRLPQSPCCALVLLTPLG
jgi:hypothetical protein